MHDMYEKTSFDCFDSDFSLRTFNLIACDNAIYISSPKVGLYLVIDKLRSSIIPKIFGFSILFKNWLQCINHLFSSWCTVCTYLES